MALYPSVHQHVTRSGIKPLHALGAQIGDVRDATNVDDDAMDRRMRKDCLMECRNQWRAFTAGGNIPAAEIADHDSTGQFSQQCTVSELDCVSGFRTMPDGLPMAADCLHGARAGMRFGQQVTYGLRIDLRKFIAEQRRRVYLIGTRLMKSE